MEGEGEDEEKIRGYSINLALETHLNFPGGYQGNSKTKIGIGCQERKVEDMIGDGRKPGMGVFLGTFDWNAEGWGGGCQASRKPGPDVPGRQF